MKIVKFKFFRLIKFKNFLKLNYNNQNLPTYPYYHLNIYLNTVFYIIYKYFPDL